MLLAYLTVSLRNDWPEYTWQIPKISPSEASLKKIRTLIPMRLYMGTAPALELNHTISNCMGEAKIRVFTRLTGTMNTLRYELQTTEQMVCH